MITPVAFEYRAVQSGLTGQLVREVVVGFYDKARQDAVLGPIFDAAIGQNWDSHIERIVQFWLTATRFGSGYDGSGFMPAHLKHRSIQIDHIQQWLDLFRTAAAERCPPQAASVLIDIAERMAETLELSLRRRDDQRSRGARNGHG